MKRHTAHKHMSKEMADVLARSKHVPTRAAQRACTGHGISPESAASLIATGKITRERSCDGKARFRTYEYAEQVRPVLEQRYGKTYETYPCFFCDGFHVCSVGEFAA